MLQGYRLPSRSTRAWRFSTIGKRRKRTARDASSMRRHGRPTMGCLLLAFCFLFGPAALVSADATPAGRMVDFKGDVELSLSDSGRWRVPVKDESLPAGTRVQTGETGWSAIMMADESLVQLSKNTLFQLTQTSQTAAWYDRRDVVPVAQVDGRRSEYQMNSGKIWIRNKNRSLSIDIHTPTVSAGIRGTELVIHIQPDRTVLMSVLEGHIQAWNEAGSIEAVSGEVIETRPGEAPVKRILLAPEDAVQWTLVVPPLGEEFALSVPSSDPRFQLQQALESFNGKDFTAAARILDAYLSDYPSDAMAWRYASLAALVRNDAGTALKAAEAAVLSGPDEPANHIVLAYTHQAEFELEKALASAERALDLDPENQTAMLLKARLLFGADRLKAARTVIGEIQRRYPENGEMLNLKGFLALAMGETDAAVTLFSRAVEESGDLGEPHLGLALAVMRKGEVSRAMEEISTAVLLEPQRSMFLSYWAKMLYQLKRFDKALELLEQAQKLDPRDPTPLLYQSIILRDLNRPTEAIHKLNAAMEKNDNRAVYRSRFLLDRDAAVKNVNLSLIYNQLGLPEWAKNKALASVKQDYSNASGHIFLAGSLFGQEARSRAGASENSLGMLLQPANVNALNSFNEYTSFFEKPYMEGALTGAIDNHDTRSGTGFVAGAFPSRRMAFSALGSLSATDGWRGTDNTDNQGLSGQIKFDPTVNDGLLFSAGYADTEAKGNTSPDVNEIDAPDRSNDRLDSESNRYTFGYYRRLAPEAMAMVYAQRRTNDTRQFAMTESFLDPTLRVDSASLDWLDRVENQVQGMLIFQKGAHQVIAGGLLYRRDSDRETAYADQYHLLDEMGWQLLDWATTFGSYASKGGDRFQSVHIQDIWNPLPKWTIEGALYWERIERTNPFDDTHWTDAELLPRLGIVFTPTPRDTIRLAAFRYLVPYAFERIDPQDIAGVTISRNTSEGAVSDETDIIWEHEWNTGLYSLNLFYNNGEDSWQYTDGARTTWKTRIKGLEQSWNQLVLNGIGIRTVHRYLDVDNDFLPEKNRQEHLVSASLTYVMRQGLRLNVAQTYRHIDFEQSARDTENIWLTDVSFGYEMPDKRGAMGVTVNNLFDNQFNWVQDPFVFSGRAPAREIIFAVTGYF